VDFSLPKSANNIKLFLGLAGYYQQFVDEFSAIARPLKIC
jgi:hypothetical protein